MRNLALFAALAASLMLTAVPANAQAVQTGAGKLDKSGWTDAASAQGAYSVRLPCLFDEQLMVAKPNSLAVKSFNLECTQADGTLFRAMRVEFNGGAGPAQDFFVRMQTFGGNHVLRAFKSGGNDAVDLKNEKDDHCAWTRQIRAGADNLMLIVEHTGTRCATLQPDVTKFFDSIVVKPR